MTTYNRSESCGICHCSFCKCDKKSRDGESLSDWLERIGFQPLTEEQKRINLESNLDFFLNNG